MIQSQKKPSQPHCWRKEMKNNNQGIRFPTSSFNISLQRAKKEVTEWWMDGKNVTARPDGTSQPLNHLTSGCLVSGCCGFRCRRSEPGWDVCLHHRRVSSWRREWLTPSSPGRRAVASKRGGGRNCGLHLFFFCLKPQSVHFNELRSMFHLSQTGPSKDNTGRY